MYNKEQKNGKFSEDMPIGEAELRNKDYACAFEKTSTNANMNVKMTC